MVEPRPLDRSWPLRGRDLRHAILAVLDRHGPSTISEILDALERGGFAVAVTVQQPNKVVSDSLRHELARGRARRVERGVFATDYLPDTTARRIRRRWANATGP